MWACVGGECVCLAVCKHQPNDNKNEQAPLALSTRPPGVAASALPCAAPTHPHHPRHPHPRRPRPPSPGPPAPRPLLGPAPPGPGPGRPGGRPGPPGPPGRRPWREWWPGPAPQQRRPPPPRCPRPGRPPGRPRPGRPPRPGRRRRPPGPGRSGCGQRRGSRAPWWARRRGGRARWGAAPWGAGPGRPCGRGGGWGRRGRGGEASAFSLASAVAWRARKASTVAPSSTPACEVGEVCGVWRERSLSFQGRAACSLLLFLFFSFVASEQG